MRFLTLQDARCQRVLKYIRSEIILLTFFVCLV